VRGGAVVQGSVFWGGATVGATVGGAQGSTAGAFGGATVGGAQGSTAGPRILTPPTGGGVEHGSKGEQHLDLQQ
jgi:hypothetical protein